MGKRQKGRSFSGRPRIRRRNVMGDGVWVRVAKPMWWRAVMKIPAAIPTDSFT